MYNKDRSSGRENALFPQRKRTPSFSSSLLDAIYRSIDGEGEEGLCQYTETAMPVIKKHRDLDSNFRGEAFVEEEEKESSNLRRDIMIETWMEKQSTCSSKSTSWSSDSSSRGGGGGGSGGSGGGGVFSSSETESSTTRVNSSSGKSSCTPLRAKILVSDKQQKPKCEGSFTRTKLRALKIYSELKKVKQPISPGGRIASFLNSIFSSGSGKKVKMCSIGEAMEDVTNYDHKSRSTSSSVTSFSKSCLSNKTPPPSRGIKSGNHNNNSHKRSVRFYPVSVIVDEDSRPCGHKCIYDQNDPGLMPSSKILKSRPLKDRVTSKEEDYYVRSYHQKNKFVSKFDFRGEFEGYIQDDEDDDDDDSDDDESCSSSDLFELDHLSGIGRYREELPVYETTSLERNHAIANGFIL